jgi:hypothetical protein
MFVMSRLVASSCQQQTRTVDSAYKIAPPITKRDTLAANDQKCEKPNENGHFLHFGAT